MLVLGSDATKGGPAPWVTWGLIVINLFAFILQLATGDAVTNGFSLVPEEVTQGRDLVAPQRVWFRAWIPNVGRGGHYEEQAVDVPQRPGPFPIHLTLFTHMFLHGSWAHLLGNLWFLFIFGGHVERALRPGLFLAGYVVCGLAAGLAQVLIEPHSYVHCLGASGAISGVMGAYLFLHPFSQLRLWLWFWVVRLPAVLVLGFWFLGQYLSAVAVHSAGGPHGGTAYAAHAGGFVAGLVFILCLWLYVNSRASATAAASIPADATHPGMLRTRPTPDGLGHFLPESSGGRTGVQESAWR